MDDLIARLEQAVEGSRELDLDIAHAVNYLGAYVAAKTARWSTMADEIELYDGQTKTGILDPVRFVPHYTTSLDAALTLVPACPTNEITGKADYQLECTNGGMTISARIGETEYSFAETLPLALCIAALKARTEENRDGLARLRLRRRPPESPHVGIMKSGWK